MNVNQSLKLCLKFNGIWDFSGIRFFSVLIAISMNFSDQLVIVIYDL